MLVACLALLAARTGAELVLDLLQRRHHRAQGACPPPPGVDPASHAKSVAYAAARSRFASTQTVVDAVLLALWLGTGALAATWGWFASVLGDGLAGQALAFFAVLVVLQLPGLPFEAWDKFRIEERFGFNRTTPLLWLADLAKGFAVALLLGYPLILGLLAVLAHVPAWWLWAAVLLFGFQLLVAVLYPTLILPLFNKLSPLPEGELRDRLLALARDTGFAVRAILVMDGSRRSSHANAFFAGFGRARRIVLYDTLVQQLTPGELAAVLAHEIGHDKLGHLPQRLVVGAVSVVAAFAVLGWLQGVPAFTAAFGFGTDAGDAPFLLLAFLLSGLVTFWLAPLGTLWSRRHEFQADAFAARVLGGPALLAGALRQLHAQNLSHLRPHPLWAAFHASHPSLHERLEALGPLLPGQPAQGSPAP